MNIDHLYVHNDDLKPAGFGLPGVVLYEINFEAQKARELQALRDRIAARKDSEILARTA